MSLTYQIGSLRVSRRFPFDMIKSYKEVTDIVVKIVDGSSPGYR